MSDPRQNLPKEPLSRHHHFLPLQQVLTPLKACYFNNCFYTVPNTHLFPSFTTHIQVSSRYFTSRCYLHLEPILILFDIQLQTRLYKAKNPTCIIQDQAGGQELSPGQDSLDSTRCKPLNWYSHTQPFLSRMI
jgi:hypothetical protein